ncbi:MAG: hypothetical protein ACRDN0_06180 [Trebonia sp.]
MTNPVDARLDRLRGRTNPKRHNARTISALATNPGCTRRALMDASGTDKNLIADHTGYPAPFGQSNFAIIRGNAFEAQVKENGAAQLLRLLRDHLRLPLEEAGYHDFNEALGNDANEIRYARTRQILTSADQNQGTLFDHPLLRLKVAGRYAYLEPDLIAFQRSGKFHIVEIKSFSVIDDQADPAKVAAAAIQSAVYVHALRDLLGGDPDQVHHETVLVCPKNFSSQPVATGIDVRKQLTVINRQLSRIGRIEDLLEQYPGDLTFDLDPAPGKPGSPGTPRRDPGDLLQAVRQVDASYSPECLSACELCYLCRDEARGTTAALGKTVRDDFGGIEYAGRALSLARGAPPAPAVAPELEEVAAQLRHAAALRTEILGEEI